MTAPAVAAARFCMAGAVGAGLGLIYGVLRPLRRKSNWLPDLIFVIFAFFGWVYVGFGICQGDLRLAYFAGMALGGFGWELTVGRLLRPVFSGFWKGIGRILGLCLFPIKKILGICEKNLKKVFAKWKKWVTMKWNIRRRRRRNLEGGRHDQSKKKALSPGACAHQPAGKGDYPVGSGAVHHCSGGAARQHRRKQKPV